MRSPIVLACLAALAACAPEGGAPEMIEVRARELAQRFLIVDTHIDAPWRMEIASGDVFERIDGADFDHARAREGGLDVAFMSIFVPASFQRQGGARDKADALIDWVEGLAAEHPDRFMLVTSAADARESHSRGVVGLAMGIENGAAIEGDLGNLEHFHRRGVRYVTLAHSRSNRICDSSYDEERPWQGLSPFGEQVVDEMNRLGMMIDISHLSDDAARQVLARTRAPVIASHSSCRKFTPGWERNISDELIRLLAESGGVVQINFGSDFVNDDYRRKNERRRAAAHEELERLGLDREDAEGREFYDRYQKSHPIPVATVAEVADHIDHVVSLVGVDHVGLGSDFDGVGDSLPKGLEDVSKYPNLLAELLRRGYEANEVEKICSGNLLRVWAAVEGVAAGS